MLRCIDIARRSLISKCVTIACIVSPIYALAGATEDFQSNFISYISQVTSGSMDVNDLGSNLALEVAVALKRGASSEEIGSVFVASAPNNDISVNMQLGAVLGAIGAMVESGAIEGDNAVAGDFHRASCDFSKSARLSQEIINIECSK